MIRAAIALCLAVVTACQADAPPRGPEATCAKACSARAGHCSSRECARGCNLVIDRLAEHEGDAVIACIAKAPAPCDDPKWAVCAARIGPHADGGPPAPPPPPDYVDDE